LGATGWIVAVSRLISHYTHSEMALPLLARGQVIGALDVSTKIYFSFIIPTLLFLHQFGQSLFFSEVKGQMR